ncbi:hypothetical protein E2C01_063133 [Portunus trituberculatus]|uniref:Uncharacterized protein n=1 Tax=Portunus trituberculatus TaxID=210409 RepID=A0A5B7HCW8_PORTR|nr:hypothetical protein [Portunus trituberculatus]
MLPYSRQCLAARSRHNGEQCKPSPLHAHCLKITYLRQHMEPATAVTPFSFPDVASWSPGPTPTPKH